MSCSFFLTPSLIAHEQSDRFLDSFKFSPTRNGKWDCCLAWLRLSRWTRHHNEGSSSKTFTLFLFWYGENADAWRRQCVIFVLLCVLKACQTQQPISSPFKHGRANLQLNSRNLLWSPPPSTFSFFDAWVLTNCSNHPTFQLIYYWKTPPFPLVPHFCSFYT